jgi:RimJ/RimL family protein N-acetyltransferase
LLLREFRPGDFDAYAAHVADPEASRYTTGPVDRRMAWRFFAAGAGTWMLQGTGWWAMELLETRAFVGTVGAFYRDGSTDLELGWSVLRGHWGQGLAHEAASAVLRHAFDVRGETRLIALIDAANAPSLRLAERLGLRHERDVDFHGGRIGRYILLANAAAECQS